MHKILRKAIDEAGKDATDETLARMIIDELWPGATWYELAPESLYHARYYLFCQDEGV